MTALALLIAIFRYQPSPFCILDEVDAPLDEANVGRFTKLVSEMSAGTQFIVVTHNRQHDGNGLGAVRRDDAGAGRLETRVRPLGRARAAQAATQRRLSSIVAQASAQWIFRIEWTGRIFAAELEASALRSFSTFRFSSPLTSPSLR